MLAMVRFSAVLIGTWSCVEFVSHKYTVYRRIYVGLYSYCSILRSSDLYNAIFNTSLGSHPTSYRVYHIDCFCSALHCPVLMIIDRYRYIDWVDMTYWKPSGQNKWKFSHPSCYHSVLLYAHVYCLSVPVGDLSFANYYEWILQWQYVPIPLLPCLHCKYQDFKSYEWTIHCRLLYIFHTHRYSMNQLD